MAVKKIESKDLILCRGANVEELKCIGMKSIDEFSNSWSYLNVIDKKIKGKDGKFENIKKLSYCKSCNDAHYKRYRDLGMSPEESLFYVCQLNNVPFIAEKVEATFAFVSSEAKRGAVVKNIFGTYYNFLARETSKHHLWQDFSCTDIDYKDIATKIEHYEVAKQEVEQLEIDWGKQDDPKDYAMLQETFDRYTRGVEFVNSQQEDLYRDLCRDRLILRKINDGRYSGDETIDKVQTRISKTMATLKVDDFESNKPKTSSEQSFFAKIAQIEQTKPADLYKEPKKYADFNKFKKYEKDLVLRPLLNTLCGHRDFDISIDDIEQYELRE